MPNIDSLNALNFNQLTALIAAASKRLKRLASRKPPAVVRRELAKVAAAHGYAINELIKGSSATSAPRTRAAKRSSTKVAPKYRDPDYARNTWSGRGRPPRWLAEKVKRGQSAADFLIPGLARPTAKKNAFIGRRTVIKSR